MSKETKKSYGWFMAFMGATFILIVYYGITQPKINNLQDQLELSNVALRGWEWNHDKRSKPAPCGYRNGGYTCSVKEWEK